MARRDIPSLDGWRAFAVTLVVFSHVAPAWATAPFHPIDLGALGVRVFFVLSGFLITRLLLAEHDRTGRVDIGAFYWRRTFRIVPALLAFLATLVGLAAGGILALPAEAFWAALLYVRNYVGSGWATGHLWSLAVEEQFYALWPLGLRVSGRRAWRIAVAALVLVPVVRYAEIRYALAHQGASATWGVATHFETVADALAAGGALAFATAWLDRSAGYQRWLATSLPLLLVPLGAAGLAMEQHPLVHSFVGIPAANLAIALLVDWTVRRPRTAVGVVLNAAPVRWVGRVSYSLYLWQQLAVANAPGRSLLAVRGGAWGALTTTIPGMVALAVTAAALSYYGVEQPFLRLRERLERRHRAQRAATTRPEPGVGLGLATAGAGPG